MKSLIPGLMFLLMSGVYTPIFAQPEPSQPPAQQPESPPEPPLSPESPPEPPLSPESPPEPPLSPESPPAKPEPTEPPSLPGEPENTPPLSEINPLAATARKTPYSVTFVAEVHEPGRLLGDLQKYLSLFFAADPAHRAGYEAGLRELKELLGGSDPFQPEQLKSLGLEPGRPWRFSVLELSGKLEPAGIVLSVAVSDPEKLGINLKRVLQVRKTATKEIAQDGQQVILALGADGVTPVSLLALDGEWLHLFLAGPGADVIQGWRSYTQELVLRPLSRDRRFQPVTVGLTPQADISGYLNLKSIADKLPLRDTPALLNDFSSAAFQLTSREFNVQTLLSRYSGVAAFLQPGQQCQELIGQADPPLLAVTYSLEQPVQLLQYLVANADPWRAGIMFPPDNVLGTGMTLEQLAELTRDGSGGLLYYEGDNYQANSFVVLACFRVTDREAGYNWMARMAGENQKAFYPNLKEGHLTPDSQPELPSGIHVKQYGPNTVWTVKTTTSGIAYAVVGDFVVLGDAVKQIHNLARGEGDGWKPRCGGGELFSAELRAGELLSSLVRHQHEQAEIIPALQAIDQYFGSNYQLVGSVHYEEGLLKASVKPALGTFGDTGSSLALLPLWGKLASGWTRKVYPEQYAYPFPENNPEPTAPLTPQAEPEPRDPQLNKPAKRLTPGGEEHDPAPQAPGQQAEPKQSAPRKLPPGGDEEPAPAPETPEGNSPPPTQPRKSPEPLQPGGDDPPEPGQNSPEAEPMVPGNAEPKTPQPESEQPQPGPETPSRSKENPQDGNRKPGAKKLTPGGDEEPEETQPAPGKSKEPGDQPPAPEENKQPQPKPEVPKEEQPMRGEPELRESRKPSTQPEQPQPETKKAQRPKKNPAARPRKKTKPNPTETQEPKPEPQAEPKPESNPQSQSDGKQQPLAPGRKQAPASRGYKASEGGGERPDIPFKEETKRHMAPLLYGIRIISGQSLGQFPGQLPFQPLPPATPDETSLDAGRSRQPSLPRLTPDQRHAA